MSKRSRAIEAIEECRSIHVWWVRMERDPAWSQQKVSRSKSAGGRAHHYKWIKNYDLVLEVLRSG